MGTEQLKSVSVQAGSPQLSKHVFSGNSFWTHPLFKLIWSTSRVDVVLGLLITPLHAATEIALGFTSGALLQLIFSNAPDTNLQRILPRQVAGLLPQLSQIGRQELTTLVPVFLIVIGFCRLLTSFGSNYLLERAGHRVAHAMRSSFLNACLAASGRIMDSRNPDELTNRTLLDTAMMQGLISKGTISALRDGLVVIGVAASMIFIASNFFFILILVFVPFFLLLRSVSRRLEFFARESARRQVELTTRGMRTRQGLLAIYGMNSRWREHSDIVGMSDSYYSFMRSTLLLRTSFRPAMEILAVLVIAGALQWKLNLNTETAAAEYATLFVLAALAFRPLKNVSSFVSQFSELKAVWQRLSEEWSLIHNARSSGSHASASGYIQMRSGHALEVRDAAFETIDGLRILHKTNLVIKERSRVALVGESGAGKSTLIRLMAGLLPPAEGTLGGTENAVLATQTAYVFQGTVFENIVYPVMPSGKPELQRARERASALVLSLMLAHTPAGAELFLNKKVGFMGEGLSGGEKARVALARLFFADRPVLLLDEPTANLDQESAAAFWSAVWAWQKQAGETRTVVAVTHNLTDLSHFDEGHLFSKGSCVASGTPQYILERMREFSSQDASVDETDGSRQT
ncbi:MAG: ABC transporter ATP-binding protein [Proteobacteria bacterium]|nr:ABC transporter ATP-binding protein [Pseudomonadota bacterium]